MKYPDQFPPESRAAVAAERIRAAADYDRARDAMPEARYGVARELEAELRIYIVRQVFVFAVEACKLARKKIWSLDQVEEEYREFLRRATIDAIYEKGRDRSGRKFGEGWIDHWGGSLKSEVMRQFEQTEQWKELRSALLQLAELQDIHTSEAGAPEDTANGARRHLESEDEHHQEQALEKSADTKGADSRKPGKNTFGRKVEALRKEAGWSYDDLAGATGIDKKLILGHINAGKNAYPSTRVKYARAFTKELDRPVLVAELEGESPEIPPT